MIDVSPLQQKKVLIPRGKGQAKTFSDLVKKYGGIPVEIPLIAFRPVEITPQLKEIFTKICTYDWLILTSNVAVDTFFSLLDEVGEGSLPKVAVIGDRTKQILIDRGVNVDFTPSEFVAEGFVRDFLPIVQPGTKVLLPKGNLARDHIAESLRQVGAIVDEVIIYETFAPSESKQKLAAAIENCELDILTFTSPSTIDHFMEIVAEYNLFDKLDGCMVASIGPVTTKKALKVGLPVHVAPANYTVKDMLDAIMEKLKASQSRRI